MRLAVSGNGYTSATNSFVDANQLAAAAAHALMGALDQSGSMAGHTAATFAHSYDHAAHQGASALVDLVDALANLGRLSEATHRNHVHAEAHAVLGGRGPVEDIARTPSYSHVSLRLPPSAAGTRGAQLPGWAAWILDRVEGFVWPDSDTDRLRAAAHAWRTACHELGPGKARCLDAAFSLSMEVAPEVELAADATRRFASQVDSLAQSFHGLARSCDDLADQVDHHRQQVLDIVRDTLRDAVIVEGIGLLLGAVTGGITAAAATSVNAARIAAIAPRIIRIIEGLRVAIGASQTGARIAAESVTEVRARVQAFTRARIIRSDRGSAGLPSSRLPGASGHTDFQMLGTTNFTRAVKFRGSDVDPRWGLTSQHVKKHLFHDGPHSLRTIDPGGNTEIWKSYLQDLATRPPTSLTNNGKIDIMGLFPKADGSGTFSLGIRLHESSDGSYELITLLTRQ